MGFISSLLCGSGDSDSPKRQKGKTAASGTGTLKTGSGVSSSRAKKSSNTKSSSRSTAANTVKQSNIHTSLSNSSAKMHAKKNSQQPHTNSNPVAGTNEAPKKVGLNTVADSGVKNENDTESDVEDVVMEGDDDIKVDEKQTVMVYNAESDTSTGTTENTVTTNRNDKPSPEATTVVHETEHTSSAEDSEAANSQGASDIDMVNADYDEGEVLDLALLQPDQAHAPGVDTLLLPKAKEFEGKKCLVLDLDETLVHSSFKYLRTADFVIPVEIDNQVHNVYVIKRPGVDDFLKRVSELYEVVVFTASVSRYGDPLLDILDKHKAVHHRLFRDSCYNYEGNYIKNLSQIGRPLSDMIILDNSPASYIFHPQHAIPISSWFSDVHDNELIDIIPLLEDLAQKRVPDVGKILDVTI